MYRKKRLKDRILDAIREMKIMDESHLEDLLEKVQEKNEGDMLKALVESGAIPDRELLRVLSQEMEIPFIDISRVSFSKEVIEIVPDKMAERYQIIPLSRIGDVLTLIVSDPTDIVAIDDVKTVTGCDINVVLATKSDINECLRALHSEEEEIFTGIDEGDDPDVEIVEQSGMMDVTEIAKESKTAPIVKMVDLIITEAVKKRASDIHIEPEEKALRIRYRIDGKLHSVFEIPKKNQNAILARLKIMSNMDITESRVPQDGRFRIKFEKREIDFRVSALPIRYGNKIVLRALDKGNLAIGLDTMGFLPGPIKDFKEALSHPYGIILVTGPTGSGKSTTLYSVLNDMNKPDINIITIEDPVEYQVGGITQIAARQEIGLDFASGLRALLRQSPDVIMVGEIRDFETADIAIKASLTGQMVLSTLHTNDAVGAITRLVNMGVEPFLVSSSLVMACAQRLLRKICPHCKVETQIAEDVVYELREKYPEAKDVGVFFKGKGCKKCGGTGYLGRMGTLETLLVDDKIREMVNARKAEQEIRDYLKEKGVKTLRDNAMVKFINGETTLEEVYRVT